MSSRVGRTASEKAVFGENGNGIDKEYRDWSCQLLVLSRRLGEQYRRIAHPTRRRTFSIPDSRSLFVWSDLRDGDTMG